MIDILKGTFLRCMATFLIWFAMSMGIGMAILLTIKVMLFLLKVIY
jgi:hypothetical protein